jgi:Viral BACON domain
MSKHMTLSSFALCLLFFSLSCKKESFVLLASVSTLDFTNQNYQSIELGSRPNGVAVKWKLLASPDWLEVTPAEGLLNGSQFASVLVKAKSNLSSGSRSGTIVFTSDIAGNVEVKTTYNVANAPMLQVSTTATTIGFQANETSFTIYNTGNTPFDWSLQHTAASNITFSPSLGKLNNADSVVVKATVNKTNLAIGDTTFNINVNTTVGLTKAIKLTVRKFEELKWLLTHDIVDAEFDRSNNRIVTVGTTPNRLYKMNPDAQTESSIDLPTAPNCVSVSSDGRFAVVGCNAKVLYINLTNMTIQNTFNISCDATDIAIADNGYAYVSPYQDQWERLRSLNLSTGLENLSTGNFLYAGAKVHYQPNSTFVYTLDTRLSPSDIVKFNIANGSPQYMYDSRYHGDYAYNGEFWFSATGDRIFSRAGNIFNASTNTTQDILYSGRLTANDPFDFNVYFTSIFHAPTTKRVLALLSQNPLFPDSKPAKQLRGYSDDFYTLLWQANLQGFYTGGVQEFEDPDGKYVFANAMGQKAYVLLRNANRNTIAVRWALQKIDIQ